MLLFTRHVLDVTLDEIRANAGTAKRLLSIRTENAEEVALSRRRVYSAAEKELDELAVEWGTKPAPRSTHRHNLVVESEAGERRPTWQVAIGFYPGPAGLLLEQARKLAQFGEKAIPETGVAVALQKDEGGAWKTAIVEGRLYCGLPLPSVSGLPVHINGCFDLDSSRIGLTSDDASLGNAKARVDWNHLLLTHAVTSAYVDAPRSIPIEIAERDPGGFYDLWPSVEHASSPMIRDAAIAIHQGLAATPLFRCETNGGIARCTFAEMLLLPANSERELKEALVADGLVLANPDLPSTLLEVFSVSTSWTEVSD